MGGGPRRNIHNIRRDLDNFSIDRLDFRMVRYSTITRDFSNDTLISTRYLPELKILLQKEIQCAGRIVFSIRRLVVSNDNEQEANSIGRHEELREKVAALNLYRYHQSILV